MVSRIVSRSVIIVLISLFGCATYEARIEDEKFASKKKHSVSAEAPDHVFYLIGDAGYNKKEGRLDHFRSLKDSLKLASENTTLLFLGDNIYPKGMPKKDHNKRAQAEHRMDSQLELLDGYKGNTIFIPGNHDYYTDGRRGVDRQARYVKKNSDKRATLLPRDGCPLEEVELSASVVLLIIDSQWYLENWDKDPTKNDNCSIKSREKFFDEFDRQLKRHANKTIVVAMHHPLFSGGPHGGQFRFSIAQFFPNMLRRTSGASLQDQQNPIYRDLKKRLLTLAQKVERIVFVSGHEHLLEYLEVNGIPQVVSGSGSKISGSGKVPGSLFSFGTLGYAKLEVFPNGETRAHFYKSTQAKDSLVYSRKVYDSGEGYDVSHLHTSFQDSIKASVYTDEYTGKTKFYQWLWGTHYRNYYYLDVKAATVDLDTLLGGLKPVRKGGGQQSRSLRLQDSLGKEYVMRAVKKSPLQFMQASMFKEQYVRDDLKDTFTENLVADVFTASHPYAPLATGVMQGTLGILYPNPRLFYIPKQRALGKYNDAFGDELYIFEERAASGHGDLVNFDYQDKIVSTDDMLENLRKSDDCYLDETAYIRARLFDMVIGDWDRHEDQWRWAEVKTGKKRKYLPVPRDRDQAFSKFDGFLFESISRILPGAKKFQVYDEEFRNLKWFNTNPFALDKSLLQNEGLETWLEQARYIQSHLTDEVIDSAFARMPLEVQDGTVEQIKSKLRGKRSRLIETAEDYYNYIYRYPVIRGNDKDNYILIERLPEGKTEVSIFNIKDGKKGTLIHNRIYDRKVTRELWIYGLDDRDVFEVIGQNRSGIRLYLVGGQNKDVYDISSGRKVYMYDFASKKNTFLTDKGKKRLTDEYHTNLYDHKKNKYTQNQFVPSLGFNPDDGFRLGFSNALSVYGFDRNPFTRKHTLKAHYYFATSGFDLNYVFEKGSVFRKWNFLIDSRYTSPNYSINFFGLGNETENPEGDLGMNYNRVRLSALVMYPGFKYIGRGGAEVELGGLYEGIELENTPGRFISEVPGIQDERQHYLGLRASYHYENYDNRAFPTMGMGFDFESGWKTNLNGDFEDSFYFRPSLSVTYKLVASGKLVLATKLKGNLVIGDDIEFYNAASIGGKDGLRGYRDQRFTGNYAYYQNSDLRYHLRKVRTGMVPLDLSVFGGFDYGRVWLKEESSNSWKTSYGGGMALGAVDMINFNAGIFTSADGTYFRFGLGFEF